jgi:hypothetical protein
VKHELEGIAAVFSMLSVDWSITIYCVYLFETWERKSARKDNRRAGTKRKSWRDAENKVF